MKPKLLSLAIGLGIPVLAVMVATPIIGQSPAQILGLPVMYFWIFAWFPLTTLCLWISWHFFDRHDTEQEGLTK